MIRMISSSAGEGEASTFKGLGDWTRDPMTLLRTRRALARAIDLLSTPLKTDDLGSSCQASMDAFCNNPKNNSDCYRTTGNYSGRTFHMPPFFALFDDSPSGKHAWRCYSHIALVNGSDGRRHWSINSTSHGQGYCTDPGFGGVGSGAIQAICAQCVTPPAGGCSPKPPPAPPPPPPPPPPPGVSTGDVFVNGMISIGCTSNFANHSIPCQYMGFRIPGLVNANGSLLAFCEGRKYGSGDFGPGGAGMGQHDLVMRRSTDSGRAYSGECIT